MSEAEQSEMFNDRSAALRLAAREYHAAVNGVVTDDDSDVRRIRRATADLESALAAIAAHPAARDELWYAARARLRARRMPSSAADHARMCEAAEARFAAALTAEA